MNNEYRTDEQYLDICEDMINGNWSQAARKCAEYGFYANDLKIKHENEVDGGLITDIWDFVELIELAGKYR